ncbi:MAG: translation initiation factor IF-2 [Phycisphaerae bacterium]
MTDKTRVHILAKELSVASKVIITKCKAEGLDVTNHMSTLSAGLEATIREWFSDGLHNTTIETTDRVDLKKVRKPRARKKTTRKKTTASETTAASGAAVGVAGDTAVATATATIAAEGGGVAVAVSEVAVDSKVDVSAVAEVGPTSEAEAPAVEIPEAAATATAAPVDVEASDRAQPSVVGEVELADSDAAGPSAQALSTARPAEASAAATEDVSAATAAVKAPELITPAGPQNIPQPVKLKGPRVVRYEPVGQGVYPPGPPRARVSPSSPRATVAQPGSLPADTDQRRRGPGRGTTGRPIARKGRSTPRRGSVDVALEKLNEWRDRDLVERKERISDATGRRIHTRRAVELPGRGRQAGPAAPKTEATVQEPIIMRELCAATGVSMVQMLPILRREFGLVATINTELSSDVAEYIALEHGIVLTVVPAKTLLDELTEEYAEHEAEDVRSRPPVVTVLGHVDHGKTSLLDAVRKTRVVEGEDGGITQHIGAYHLEHETAGKVTFVDTPGHAAFTAMRARGAQITDIVVLVVAADDGVMPQTLEAINHAKAAEVPVVVALNKSDLGTQNINKIYGQLAEQGLQPSGDWGGDVDVIHTSAVTGQGVEELIEHLVALGEVLDLKADFQGEAAGTVIEAETKEGVGAVVRVLVQNGLLRTGDTVVCGNAFGKVRALRDDRGGRINEAGPSIPCELWGLDEVPLAGDRFFVLKSSQRAKQVAGDCRQRRVHAGRAQSQRVRSLEEAFQQHNADEIPELNIIIKADVDGSVDALRYMLMKIPSEEVKLAIRHSGVGAVNESDVLLADASDAIVIAFRVLPGSGAKHLAEEKGVDVRQYKVIYEVADDVKAALEGLLTPDEKMETRGTCTVREVFSITKVGQVAGCMVTDGVVQRNHLLRLIRDGTVVRDRSKIGSLRRFKDDVKEVRAGMECGIRIEGFDDVKPQDVIEAYEIVKLARTL